jgi:hypothetical protein
MRTLQRAVRAALFDRKVHTELFFDSNATADAVLLVAAISAVTYLDVLLSVGFTAFSLAGLLETVIGGLVAWLILAAGTWVAAAKLLDGGGQIQTMMRLHGHAELPLLLVVLGPWGALVGYVWSLAAKVVATREAASLDLPKAVAAILIGVVLVVIVQLLFSLPFRAFSAIF